MRTMRKLITGLMMVAASAFAEFYHIGSVHNGVGQISDNTAEIDGRQWRHVSAGAQPGGIQSGSAGGVDHRAGFLQAVEVRRADLDTDGNGVPNELDADNDGDSLSDISELDGSAFQGYAVTDNNDPDTDDDGMTDTDEAAGMYDPLDPEHRLAIVQFELDAGSPRVYWVGKGGGIENTVLSSDDLVETPFTNVVSSSPYFGGDAPWYKVTNTTSWIASDAVRMIQIRTE